MPGPAAHTLCLFALWLTATSNQVKTQPSTNSTGPISSVSVPSPGPIPNVSLTVQVSVINNLQCQKDIICRLNAPKSILGRILEITILETRTQTELKKVASIYYLKAEDIALDRSDLVESIHGIVKENGSLVVHKALPPNTGFAGEEFVCKVLYIDTALGVNFMESDRLEQAQYGVCQVPDVLQKLNVLEMKLGNLSDQQSNQCKSSDVETREVDCKVSDLANKIDLLDNKLTKISSSEDKLKQSDVQVLARVLKVIGKNLNNLSDDDALCKMCGAPDASNRLDVLENQLRMVSEVQRNQTELLSNLFTFINSKFEDLNKTSPVARRERSSCDSFRGLYDNDDIPTRHVITWPDGVRVLCDTKTSGGGWTIIQKRLNGSENFTRSWDHYENGFGSITGEFWLGLRHVQNLAKGGNYELRIDMKSHTGHDVYALYSNFSLSPRSSHYKLDVGGFSGNVNQDSMEWHNGMAFTTWDKDNDLDRSANCAKVRGGGWWYNVCDNVNLNRLWTQGMKWEGVTYDSNTVVYSEMKVRSRK